MSEAVKDPTSSLYRFDERRRLIGTIERIQAKHPHITLGWLIAESLIERYLRYPTPLSSDLDLCEAFMQIEKDLEKDTKKTDTSE